MNSNECQYKIEEENVPTALADASQQKAGITPRNISRAEELHHLTDNFGKNDYRLCRILQY